MKKLMVLCCATLLIAGSSRAQYFSVTGYGGYLFQDKVSFANAYGYIKESGFWGASFEGVNREGAGFELLYQGQNTHVPMYTYGGLKSDRPDGLTCSYILINGVRYLQNNDHVQPYAGIGAGVAIINSDAGSSQTKFAWDFKLGIKLKTASVVGFKLQAQLNSITQAGGASLYASPIGGLYVSSYSTIWQFGFAGGLVFDFEKK
jgi:opacity protein-like surface antigen